MNNYSTLIWKKAGNLLNRYHFAFEKDLLRLMFKFTGLRLPVTALKNTVLRIRITKYCTS